MEVIFSFCLTSCQDSPDRPQINIDTEFGADLESISVTPISASFNTRFSSFYRVYYSEDKDALEKVINDIKKTGNLDSTYPDNVSMLLSNERKSHITTYSLQPNTKYYYFLTTKYGGEGKYGAIDISKIKEFKTEEIKLYVSIEGSDVIWCGVNFIPNRGKFDENQFLQSKLYYQDSLPDPSEEMLEGNWRYPTKEEMEQLVENCSITFIDYDKMFARITDKTGNNLYLPFNEKFIANNFVGIPNCGFPYEYGWGGLFLESNSGYDYRENEFYSPFFGSGLKNNKIYINDNFYTWSYINLQGKTVSGTNPRGIRFVMDK